MMKIIIYFFIFIVSASLSYSSYAVEFVYRVDSRPPSVVFRDGFTSHGNNRNLQQHIRGYSCAAGSRDSIYIATTSDINETHNIARQYYSSSLFHGTLYRYRIRANNIFYSLEPSVDYLSTVRRVEFSRFEQMMMREQQEVVAISHIPVENIVDATELNYDPLTSRVTDGAGISNAHYLNIQTSSNPGVIPRLPYPQVSVRERISAFGSLLTACFSLKGSNDFINHNNNNFPPKEIILFFDAKPVMKELITNTK